jgi:putative membrane protein
MHGHWGIPLGIVLFALFYSIGLHRLWRASGRGRGVSTRAALSCDAGIVVLIIALLSPLHQMGQELFAAHMIQHELLMIVAAPLLIIGRPLVALAWSVPRRWTRRAGMLLGRRPVRDAWKAMSAPMVAWLLHAIVLWGWHHPILFQLSVTSDVAHGLQHTSFFLSALLFWWALLRNGHARAHGAGILYLFTTALHTGLLGALLTFAPHPWYPVYGTSALRWGVTALEDQQLGGLIMWAPGSLVYVAAGCVLFVRWLRASQRRNAHAARASRATVTAPVA